MSKTDDIYVYGEVYLKADQIFANTSLKVTLVNLKSNEVLEQQRITLVPTGNEQAIDFKMHFDPLKVSKTDEYAIYAEINSLSHVTHTARQHYPVDLSNKTPSASVFMSHNPRALV
jgi:uncharacterized lipoprotein YbaY